MGQPKALLPWAGRTLLEYQLAQLAASLVAETIVVLGHRATLLQPLVAGATRARSIVNWQYRSGKVSSIIAGVRSLREDVTDLLIQAVDQPCPYQIINRLIQQHLATRRPITVPVYQGRRGHPTVFASCLFPELLAISETTLGLRQVTKRHETEVQEVEVDSPLVLLDLNRPEDYQRAQALWVSSTGSDPLCFR